MKLPTIEQLKTAPSNDDFFNSPMQLIYSDRSMSVHEIVYEGKKIKVLKVLSTYGTRPVYRIEPGTLKLKYLMHEAED